ncbi:MAG: ABC transporter permease subunit [Pseudomonadota bacterium]
MANTTDPVGGGGRLAPTLRWGRVDLAKPLAFFAVIAVSVLILALFGGEQTFPEAITSRFAFVDWINQAEDWLKANLRWFTRGISDGVGWALGGLEEFLWTAPWLVVLVAFVIPSLAYGGLRLALLSAACVMIWGAFDMWFEAMSTLAMMGVSVGLCIVIGAAVGVSCAQSDRVEAFVRPILDAMQVMPAFVYLMPAIFFFGIGPTSATMAVMIYALPPMIRLTNLGIRQVPGTMIEAAESFGTTKRQLLWKVQIPQALPSIMLGVNQTIMMALALAVLAVFVGGGGIGEQVWKAITRLQVGWSLEGGLCIVVMAIMMDRLSQAMSRPTVLPRLDDGEMRFRLLPQNWEPIAPARWVETVVDWIWRAGAAPGRAVIAAARAVNAEAGRVVAARIHAVMAILLIALILIVGDNARDLAKATGLSFKWVTDYPKALEFSIREPIDAGIEWLTLNPAFIAVTKWIRAVVYLYFLNPLDTFLTELPWWYVIALFTGLIGLAAGRRLALLTFVSLAFCGAAGLWDLTMYTLAGTAVSVLICLIVGAPLGVWAANSKIVDEAMKPVLDLMQTIPSFVYLIPALFFFGGNPTTAIIATVIYAIPPIIRTTALGLRQVPAEIGEVGRSFGATSLQTLIKVKLPLASPSIMLGVNQTVIMALAMQTVTPLVAGLGLGKEVYDAMNVANSGKGLVAGIGIVVMAVILDRLTQAMTATQRKALGLD